MSPVAVEACDRSQAASRSTCSITNSRATQGGEACHGAPAC